MNKRIIIVLTGIFLMFLLFYNTKYIRTDNEDKLQDYSIIYFPFIGLEKTLSNLKYTYPIRSGKQYISIFIVNGLHISVKEYAVQNDQTLNIKVPVNCKFIFSAHRNITTAYKWEAGSITNNNIISLNSEFSTNIPSQGRLKTGENYDRQNFLFEAKENGNGSVVFLCKHAEIESDSFKVTINAEIY